MKTRFSIVALAMALFAACAAPPRIPQREIPPPRPEWGSPARPQHMSEEATKRFLDSEIERRSEGSVPSVPSAPPTNADRYRKPEASRNGGTDEQATRLFLDAEIERRSYVPPSPQPERVVERIYQPVPVQQYVYDDVGRYEYQRYRSRFPWNTAVGAGLGAVIGHQSGHRDRGAAIGAGIGLLFDMARWR